jgi:RNA polymerase sigma factor (TIGR02999 family)
MLGVPFARSRVSPSFAVTGNRAETRHAADPGALDQAVTQAYTELRAIAHRRLVSLAAGGQGATLSTTALVHEAWLKLAGKPDSGIRDHAHLLAVASLAMHHVIVDRARERQTAKRGGEPRHVTLDDDALTAADVSESVLQLNEALERLATTEPRLAQVVECRFFGGLTEAETADALGVTVRTVQRDWAKARELLREALQR